MLLSVAVEQQAPGTPVLKRSASMRMMSLLILLVVVAATSAQWISSFSPLYRGPAPVSSGDATSNRFGGTVEQPLADRFGFDISAVNEVEKYPQGSRPFWYLNRQAIAQHIGRIQPAGGASANTLANRGSFGGPVIAGTPLYRSSFAGPLPGSSSVVSSSSVPVETTYSSELPNSTPN